MKSQLLPILIISVASFFGAAANILFKKASAQVLEVPVYQNWALLLGLVLFSLVLVMFLTAFRWGGETIVVYPTYATTYIWIVFLSYKFDGASISKIQMLGIAFVMLGVSLIGTASSKPN